MRVARAWVRRLLSLFDGRRRDRDFDAELESHLQLHIDDNVRAGMTPDEARRRALVVLGGVAATTQLHRERRGILWLEQLLQDLRYGVRGLRSGTSWTAIAMLALAIGLTTAMFAVVDALMLRPVPFPNADRLAQVSMGDEHGTRPPLWSVVMAWKQRGAFDAVAAWMSGSGVVDGDTGPIVTTTASVTAGMFELIGIQPIRGRTFSADDARAGRDIMISEDLWRRAFRADPSMIGRSVAVEGNPAVVVGILPRTFRFPRWDTEVWRPLAEGNGGEGTNDRPVTVVRFSTNIPDAQALRVATELAHQEDSGTKSQAAVRSSLAGWGNSRYAEGAVPLLAGGVMLVFLTLCTNVSGLLLARFNARRRQFGLCTALGASRGRLLSQAFVETAVLAGAGAVGGLVLAWQLVEAAERLLPRSFLERSLHPLQIEASTLLLASGLAVLSTVLAGLVPAWVATRLDASTSLRLVERGGTETRGARLLSRAFIVSEVALACTLLVGTALLVRSFLNLTEIDRGFDSGGLTIVQVGFDNALAPTREARLPMVDVATDALRGLPEVERIAWSRGAPTVGTEFYFGSDWLPDTAGAKPIKLSANGMYVGGDFFALFGIELLRGRVLQAGDGPNDAVIDDRMAGALWPGTPAEGRSFKMGSRTVNVVGVVRTVRRQIVDQDRDRPTMYWPFVPGARSATVGIRCRTTCPSEGVIRQRLLSVGPAFRVSAVKTADAAYDEDLAEPRLTASVAVVFAGIALLAAAGGLFSVLTYAVGKRRREFGIRSALGASTRAIGALVLREGLLVAVLGLGIGSVAASYLARALASVQYGVTISDPGIWLTVVGVLAITIAIASWRPVRAAMRVNPVELLKEE